METVLLTGGSGLVGRNLIRTLNDNGFNTRVLIRQKEKADGNRSFFWDYKNKFIDANALAGIDYIINLAGANIGTKRWTHSYKKEIYESRVESTRFLFEAIQKSNTRLKKFISASATGYYGDNHKTNLKEEDLPGNDFLSKVCRDWETESLRFSELKIPVCIFRMGVVMTKQGGFIPLISEMIKRGLGAHLGSGEQYISWISSNDLNDIYLLAVENPGIAGIYNAVSSQPLKASVIDNMIADHYGKKIWLPNIPSFFLKLILGEKSAIILNSCHADNSKLKNAGYKFIDEDFAKVI
jgi:uncharacterized protein (TIGR01777 family)